MIASSLDRPWSKRIFPSLGRADAITRAWHRTVVVPDTILRSQKVSSRNNCRSSVSIQSWLMLSSITTLDCKSLPLISLHLCWSKFEKGSKTQKHIYIKRKAQETKTHTSVLLSKNINWHVFVLVATFVTHCDCAVSLSAHCGVMLLIYTVCQTVAPTFQKSSWTQKNM